MGSEMCIRDSCYHRFLKMGANYYNGYKPIEMMLQTDHFYNFVEYYYDVFRKADGVTQSHAWKLYQEYTSEYQIQYPYNGMRFRDEFRNYFKNFEPFTIIDGKRVSSYYSGFDTSKFYSAKQPVVEKPKISMDETESLLDEMLSGSPAQYATDSGTPRIKWKNVTTTLKDLDTSKLHYVKPEKNHIVIDFDIRNEKGEKDKQLNLEAAAKWPETYAEFSKSGAGIHLHYIYEGDPTELSRVFDEGIEIKVFTGDSSLRRQLSTCNAIPVSTINSGLPLRETKVLTEYTIKSEKTLRDLILRNLNKEVHPSTASSVSFINKLLDDAYESGMEYDVTDLQPRILIFANGSTNQANNCLRMVKHMKFKSENEEMSREVPSDDGRLVFFDCEVYPNLFLLNWKYEGADNVVRMINPSPSEVEALTKSRLIGFNCRRYDNHILYGRIMGYDNEQLYNLSKRIIEGAPNSLFGAAYNLSYADVYDYSSKKQSLKKWQIELGLVHKEIHIPWDLPVATDLWDKVSEYCDNDVITTEQVHQARIQDFNARKILSELSGLPVNATTNTHSAQIVFKGNQKKIEKDREFVYTDLSTGDRSDGTNDSVKFEGYTFDHGKSHYRGEDPSEGGYVYGEPGMYENVAVIDVASMHPSSIINLNLFGKYTKNFSELLQSRLAIKHGDKEKAASMMDGAFEKFLGSSDDMKALSDALKIVINSVYGLTSAKFDNPFRDIRNKDNIVAKRGALFMIDLKNYVQSQGYQVIHIKTDSIKIPNADQSIIDNVTEFGKKYGYDFEFDPEQDLYERLCLVNEAVYIAKRANSDIWDAVGAQFQHPYVYKKLFSREPIKFEDLMETKSVTTALYIDYRAEEDTPAALSELPDPDFIGRVGSFIPVTRGGGPLLREKDGKYHSATGAKGYNWEESNVVREKVDLSSVESSDLIDWTYYKRLVDEAVEKLQTYGDVEWFTKG